MKISEIYEEEKSFSGGIIARQEGLFWKVYEKSAFLLFRSGYAYQVNVKAVKSLHEGVVSMGFPQKAMDAIKESLGVFEEKPDRILLRPKGAFDLAAFRTWKEEMVKSSEGRRGKAPVVKTISPSGEIPAEEEDWREGVIREIEVFDMASARMVDCTIFLSGIKGKIATHRKSS